jgi:hypothetical protein
MFLEADGVVKTPLEAKGVDTTVRGGDSNAPPKDGVVTASKTFAEVWAEVRPEEGWANLFPLNFNNPASLERWEEPATLNAGSGSSNARLRGGVVVGSGTCADQAPAGLKERPGWEA